MDITKCIIFFDFDNTITEFDVIDDMLERFASDDRWRLLEDQWKAGEIGSRECLDGQMRSIRIAKKELDGYLKTIKLDPYFKKILEFCNANSIKKMILSDNFYYIISNILKNNGIEGLEIYCNSIEISDRGLEPKFPYTNNSCDKCAHCKTNNLMANIENGFTAVYVGDGLSDLCPSRRADLVFAKATLKKHLRQEKMPYISFNNLKDVYGHLTRR